MIKKAEDAFGPVDTLINNAGISCDKLFTDTSPEDWSRTFAINVGGAYNCCRAVLPGMISRKRGSIVNVSSMWGVTGGSCGGIRPGLYGCLQRHIPPLTYNSLYYSGVGAV